MYPRSQSEAVAGSGSTLSQPACRRCDLARRQLYLQPMECWASQSGLRPGDRKGPEGFVSQGAPGPAAELPRAPLGTAVAQGMPWLS